MNARNLTLSALAIFTAAALGACDQSSPPAAQSSQTQSGNAQSAQSPEKPNAPAAGTALPTKAEPDSAPVDANSGDAQQTVAAGQLTWAIPPGWSQRPASSSMRAAELIVPAPSDSGLDPAIVAFFANIGGSVQDNINRWTGQITEQQGEAVTESFTKGHLTITHVYARGRYFAGVGMGAGEPIEDAILYGAVVSGGPTGNVFIKLVGDTPVLEPQREAWMEMLKSVEPAN